MANSDPWPLIHTEREALAADLSTLTGATGPQLSLILAMTGRSTALADLSGEGVATLRTRG